MYRTVRLYTNHKKSTRESSSFLSSLADPLADRDSLPLLIMKLTEDKVLELIDENNKLYQPTYETDWTPFWTSMAVVAWLICSLFHYQIQRATYRTEESKPEVQQVAQNYYDQHQICAAAQPCISIGFNVADPYDERPIWTNFDRVGILFSCIFGPLALIYDAVTVNEGSKPGW